MSTKNGDDPHAEQPVYRTGAALDTARAAMVLIHGRGASAEDILGLAGELKRPQLAYLAPQAAGNTWYPHRFVAPLAANEPYLSSALRAVHSVVQLIENSAISADRIVLLGFSQGACLAAEYAARNTRRYGGVAVLSGGLIGPPETPRDYAGSLDGTPVFLGCSDVDPHIPQALVDASAEVFERLGAAVDKRIYPGMSHTVNRDELDAVRAILDGLA